MSATLRQIVADLQAAPDEDLQLALSQLTPGQRLTLRSWLAGPPGAGDGSTPSTDAELADRYQQRRNRVMNAARPHLAPWEWVKDIIGVADAMARRLRT